MAQEGKSGGAQPRMVALVAVSEAGEVFLIHEEELIKHRRKDLETNDYDIFRKSLKEASGEGLQSVVYMDYTVLADAAFVPPRR